MNEQQKAAIEKYAKTQAIDQQGYMSSTEYHTAKDAMLEVIEHPERYGLQPVNQWVKIEPDGSNLPEKHGSYMFFGKDSNKAERNEWYGLFKKQILEQYSHFKQIDPEIPPTDVEPK